MYRNVLIAGGLMMAIAASAPAAAQSVPYYGKPLPLNSQAYAQVIPGLRDWPSTAPRRFDWREANQMLRWAGVGRCVAAKDRAASLSYVMAERGSPEAAAAVERLDPAFAACIADWRVVGRNNGAYRRAALADALGVRLPTKS